MSRTRLETELLLACREGREHHAESHTFTTIAVSNGWGVRTEAVYNTPRGGPMAAWKYLYYLLPPNSSNKLGGYDRADSFAAWAANYISRQMTLLHSQADSHRITKVTA